MGKSCSISTYSDKAHKGLDKKPFTMHTHTADLSPLDVWHKSTSFIYSSSWKHALHSHTHTHTHSLWQHDEHTLFIVFIMLCNVWSVSVKENILEHNIPSKYELMLLLVI